MLTKEKQQLNTYEIPFSSLIQTAGWPRIQWRQQEIATSFSSELMGSFQISKALNQIVVSLERLSLTTSVLHNCSPIAKYNFLDTYLDPVNYT